MKEHEKIGQPQINELLGQARGQVRDNGLLRGAQSQGARLRRVPCPPFLRCQWTLGGNIINLTVYFDPGLEVWKHLCSSRLIHISQTRLQWEYFVLTNHFLERRQNAAEFQGLPPQSTRGAGPRHGEAFDKASSINTNRNNRINTIVSLFHDTVWLSTRLESRKGHGPKPSTKKHS